MTERPIRIDPDYLQQTLVDLVRIDSTNPLLSPEGKGEQEIGAYVARALQALGLEVIVDEIAPGRVNVVGVLPGAGSSTGSSPASLNQTATAPRFSRQASTSSAEWSASAVSSWSQDMMTGIRVAGEKPRLR